MHIQDFRAGDTVEHVLSLPDYPNDTWTLTYYFRGPSTLDQVATAGDTTNDYKLSLSTAQTSALTPGQYWWEAKVSDGTSQYTVASYQVKILVNLATISGVYDGSSEKEKLLIQINDAISKLTNGAVQKYKIHEREMTYVDLEYLIKWRDQIRIEVNREQFPDRRIVTSRF